MENDAGDLEFFQPFADVENVSLPLRLDGVVGVFLKLAENFSGVVVRILFILFAPAFNDDDDML